MIRHGCGAQRPTAPPRPCQPSCPSTGAGRITTPRIRVHASRHAQPPGARRGPHGFSMACIAPTRYMRSPPALAGRERRRRPPRSGGGATVRGGPGRMHRAAARGLRTAMAESSSNPSHPQSESSPSIRVISLYPSSPRLHTEPLRVLGLRRGRACAAMACAGASGTAGTVPVPPAAPIAGRAEGRSCRGVLT